MNKKLSDGLAIIMPNKKINLFVIFMLILGIISGCIFLMTLKDADKDIIINQINNFIKNINDNQINNNRGFLNSLYENYIYIFLVWILGTSIIGIIINIFLIYFKGFIYGFTISSFYIVFKYKGLLLSFIYVFPTIIINLIMITILSVYSILFTSYLFKVIFSKERNTQIKKFFKRYIIILLICLVMALISSLFEGYLIPSIIKLVIKLFI